MPFLRLDGADENRVAIFDVQHKSISLPKVPIQQNFALKCNPAEPLCGVGHLNGAKALQVAANSGGVGDDKGVLPLRERIQQFVDAVCHPGADLTEGLAVRIFEVRVFVLAFPERSVLPGRVAGAALGKPLTDVERQMYFVDTDKELSPIACAYIRARGADRLCSYGDWAALSDTCDADTASYLAHEVSDGIIAPDFTAEALEILKTKRKGGYNVVKIDPNYEPKPIEQRDIFGIRFEQGYNNYEINESLLTNIVTENKNLPESAKHDMILALITLKYTQSNSVCYVKDGMTIGVGAGQQSRIHCTRLAGNKADIWYLRQHEKVLNLPFKEGIRRPDRDNTIDVYISDEHDDVLRDGVWQQFFTEKPEVFTREEKAAWLATFKGVSVGSDAFFPFGDNIERAHKSGVEFIAQPGRLYPAMTTSSIRATSMASPWHSRASVCSTIDPKGEVLLYEYSGYRQRRT